LPLKAVQLEWVAAPGFGPVEDCIPLRDMAKYPILSQTQGSGLQRLVLDWAVANGLRINRVVQCNSLNVLAGLAASGLGVTFLTASYFGADISSGRLRIIKTEPAIPPIRYFAVHRAQDLSPLAARIADIAQECCDISARSLPDR
jgi:DNA-binding transcriptional LysR family regulator